MNMILATFSLVLSATAASTIGHAGDKLEGPYLGQTPPGMTPEVFAPGIVNTEAFEEKEGMFAGDMNSFYFIRGDKDGPARQLIVLKNKSKQWHQSIVMEGETEPSFSPDGKIIYFQNKFVERTNDGWSELKSLGMPLEDILIMRPSVSSRKTIYFDTFSPGLDVPVRYSRMIDGKYEEPKLLGEQFGIGKYNAHPFIAPDESYIIWDSRREGGEGSSDLYISYQAEDGSWSPAINLGEKINTADAENYPTVSPDGKYLFFDRRTGSGNNRQVAIYWVNAQFIEGLRPQK